MNKVIKKLIALIIIINLTFSSSLTLALSNDLCSKPEKLLFGFFNGMRADPDHAQKHLDAFESIYGTQSPAGDEIEYDLFYNQTKGSILDTIEIFEQIFVESNPALFHNRYEYFDEVANGSDTMLSKIINFLDKKKQNNRIKMSERMLGVISISAKVIRETAYAIATNDYTKAFADANTYNEYAIHRARLENHVMRGSKLLLVAYSQGNLFIQQAFDYASSISTGLNSTIAVQIAPASQGVIGVHTLSDKDLIIRYVLGILGQTVAITDKNHFNSHDKMGHGLLESYLDISQTNPFRKQSTYNRINDQINHAFYTLQKQTKQIADGFFTIMFKWDGEGDADLHVFEPNGTHVFW